MNKAIQPTAETRPNRRRILWGGAFGVLALAVFAGANRNLFYGVITEHREGSVLDAPAARDAVTAGELILVDIRRPDEWEATGLPEGAVPIDMRREDFIDALSEIAGGQSRPVALICARGVRSARLANRLIESGFTDIRDVPEGMLGSSAGPGWLARGLPLERP